MDLLQRFAEHIRKLQLFSQKDKLILAVSGGVDSVVLCGLCKQAGYNFMIAHCNFQLRGEESERDERFVIELGERYKAEVKVKRFETENYAAENKLSIQEAARKLRYTWFDELVNSEKNLLKNKSSGDNIHHSPLTIHLLTAHHTDDNNETLLMNFFRGTGLHGLTGIPEKAGYIRRPLLSFSKEELLAYAREHNLQWVEDSSNESSKYTRNYFRNELIPALQKVFPQVKENLRDNISRFKEIEALYRLSVDAVKKKLVRKKGNELYIPVKQLLGYYNRALIYDIITEFGFTEKQVDEVIKLGNSESGRYVDAPGGDYRIIKHRHWFIISPAAADKSENIIINESTADVAFELGHLKLQGFPAAGYNLPANHSTASFDRKQVSFPLILRKWKTGDYFYPLGMKKQSSDKQGKKKVARFLIDQKLSKTDKEKVWVLESNRRIIWVVGMRIDNRVKITDKTKQVLQMQLA
jgi:tRNA(Ile)-lysidine synthase